jgi:PAS domain-containing protein
MRSKARVVERDPNGEAVRMIGNHEDITAEKMAEQAYRDSEKAIA